MVECKHCSIELNDTEYQYCNNCKINNSLNQFRTIPKKKTRKEKSK